LGIAAPSSYAAAGDAGMPDVLDGLQPLLGGRALRRFRFSLPQ
jgi:hypothetical protein